MILSVNSNSSYKTAAGEVRCASNQLGTIFEFVKSHPNKRYNVLLQEKENLDKAIEQVKYIQAVADDYTIECNNIAAAKALIALGYNAYIRFPVTDWETFQGLLNFGCSDIFIDGPLGFQMTEIAKAKGETKIRVMPTTSPNASLCAPSASHFFIRPEDKALYEPAIDIFDLRQGDLEKENAVFSIYNRGSFNFDIDELIENVPSDVNNFALANFAEKRLNCRQRCKEPGSRCRWCDTQFSFVSTATKYGKLKT